MLPAHLQELLTAAVDGELSHAERRMVDTLLRDSEEARVFHAQLLKDAEQLRNAPRQTSPDDLATSIMAMINDRCMRPTPLPMRRRRTRREAAQFLPWFSVATVAVVLIAVSVVSYLFFETAQRGVFNRPNESAVNPGNNQPKVDPAKPKQAEPKFEEPLLAELLPVPREAEPPAIVMNEPKIESELLPNPRVAGFEDLHATPVLPEGQLFKTVPISLSLLLPLKDLDQPYPKKQLRDELKKDEIFRLDLFCRDSTKAGELLQAALKSRGQQITVDALAHDRFKKRLKTEYVFFTESLTADEIALLLEALGSDDRKAEEKKAGEGQFDKFLLTPFVNDDASELSKLLGVRRDALKLPKSRITFDPRKSLESNTAAQLGSNLPKGSGSRTDKWTLILPNGPFADPKNSKEIKSFLEKRTERKPGTVTLMLVLRPLP